jgi:hypothetical protein
MTTINTQLPTLALDEHGGWELILPATVLPAMIAAISITDNGIYIETTDGAYDLISYADLEDMIIPGRLGRVVASSNGASAWVVNAIYLPDTIGVIPSD